MHGVLRELRAVEVVRGIRRHAADHVARVDILHARRHLPLREEGGDPLLQERADVPELLVATRVGAGARLQELLPRALGDHDHRALALGEPVAELLEQAARPFQLEGHLGDQHEVHVSARERGVACDEARIAAHELDEPDAVHAAERLDVGAFHRLHRDAERGLKPERLVEIHDVVVDRLGNADDGFLESAPVDLVGEFRGALQRAVAADDEEHVDLHFLQPVHHRPDVLRAARAAEDRAAEVVDLRGGFGPKGHRRVAVDADEPFVAVAQAERFCDAVARVALGDDAADHVIEPGAESAAGDDGRGGPAGLEEDFFPRPRHLEAELRLRSLAGRHAVVDEHALAVGLEIHIHTGVMQR